MECASEGRRAGTHSHWHAIDEKRYGQEVQNREERKEAQGREETREENHVKGCGDAHPSLARVILPGPCVLDVRCIPKLPNLRAEPAPQRAPHLKCEGTLLSANLRRSGHAFHQ